MDGMGAQARQAAGSQPTAARGLRRVSGEGGRLDGAAANVRYVITLDSDTQLPRDSAATLIGAIAHPLNAGRGGPGHPHGGGGLWHSAAAHRHQRPIGGAQPAGRAVLRSKPDSIFTRAPISDVYQDLFGEGIFTGKGIYEVDALREVLEHRFPENALLSHDLIEGAYARAALVSDIELIDDYPSHFSAYSRRKHRWVRGDWQIMRWIRSACPDYYGRMIRNPISLISQWKILDNLRRSLLEPSLLLLCSAAGSGCRAPGVLDGWRRGLMWCVPVLSRSVLRAAAFAAHAPGSCRRGPAIRPARFVKAPWIAMCEPDFSAAPGADLDGCHRARRGRVFVTRKKMLEWETAAEAEAGGRPNRRSIFIWNGRRGSRWASRSHSGFCGRRRCWPPRQCFYCGSCRGRFPAG